MKYRFVYAVVVLTQLLLLPGCFDDIKMVLDLKGNFGFFDRGFPSDLSLRKDGTPDYSRFPNPLNPTLKSYKNVVHSGMKGYSPTSPVYIRFEGSVDEDDLLIRDNPLDYRSDHAEVQLIDVDPDSPERGRRFALRVAFAGDGDAYRPEGLLQILPVGRYLNENTTYAAIVLRSIAGSDASELVPNRVLQTLLEGGNPRRADRKIKRSTAGKAMAVYAPLAEQLAMEAISPADVIGAVVWTTGGPTERVRSLLAAVDDWPRPEINRAFEVIGETEDSFILESAWTVPGLQKGLFPYVLPVNGGAIQYKSNGEPRIQYSRESPIVVSVPKRPMPSGGYPVVFYNHGTGGYATQFFERGYTNSDEVQNGAGNVAALAAKEGWAATGMGGHMGGDHEDASPFLNLIADAVPGLSLNIAAYNFMNPQAMRDSFLQMVAERALFRRLIEGLTIDGSLLPGHPDTVIRFSDKRQVVTGQSLGSMTATALATAEEKQYLGLGGSGAAAFDFSLVMHLYALTDDTPLGHILEPLFFWTSAGTITDDPMHPVWSLTGQALAPSNTGLMAHRWTKSEPDTHVFLVEGHFDDWTPVPTQKLLLLALQSDLAGPELPVRAEDQLITYIRYAGGTRLDYPVAGNFRGRTNVAVRYPEDGIMSGHHVFFQYEAPKRQFSRFLADIRDDRVPVIIE